MTARHTKFYLDKQNGKWMGVCAGIADYTGVDVTLVRIGVGAADRARLGHDDHRLSRSPPGWRRRSRASSTTRRPEQTKFWQGVRASPARTVRDVRSRFRDIDRRLADVETYVTSSNSRARPRDRAAALSAADKGRIDMNFQGPDFVIAIIAITHRRLGADQLDPGAGTAIRSRTNGAARRTKDDSEARRARSSCCPARMSGLKGQIGRLEERLAVLERIATDPAERTAREIEQLR